MGRAGLTIFNIKCAYAKNEKGTMHCTIPLYVDF